MFESNCFHTCIGNTNLFSEPEVFLTVSSEAGYETVENTTILLDRKLELNWNNFDNHQDGDIVALFNSNPEQLLPSFLSVLSPSVNIIESVPVSNSKGYFKTSIKYERMNLTSTSEPCAPGYWIGYLRQNPLSHRNYLVVKSNCLRIYPRWMKSLKDVIGHRSVHSVMIPGTHNAGSIRYYDGLGSENPVTHYAVW